MWPRDLFASWGFFCWSERRFDGGGGTALPGERERGAAGAARGDRVGGPDAGPDGRPKVLRPARALAARDAAALRVRRVRVRRGARLRRLVDSRVAGDLRVRHAPDARPGDGGARPLYRGADALA